MRQSVRFSPLVGLDGSRQGEEISGTSLPMRGGYNVEAVDGEWHSRFGRKTLVGGQTACNIGSLPWFWILTTGYRNYIANPWYALAIDTTGRVDNCTTLKETGQIDFTNNSAEADINNGLTNLAEGDLILAGPNESEGAHCYRVLARYLNAIVLDRPYEENTATIGVRTIEPFQSLAAVDLTTGIKGGAVLFDQLVTDSSKGLTAKKTYMVIASELNTNPVAILLDDSGAVVRSTPKTTWFRDTAPSAHASIGTPFYPCVASGRLVLARCPDTEPAFDSRTLWYSAPGDLSQWHTGISGGLAGSNYVTFDQTTDNEIMGVLPMGNGFVVYRKFSQMIATPTGSGRSPFRFTENNQGIGLNVPGGVVEANGQHYLTTQSGPAVFDGQRLHVLGDGLRLHLERNGFWHKGIYKVCHDPEQRQVLFLSNNPVHQKSVEPYTRSTTYELPHGATELGTYASTNPVLVHDYGRGTWWFDNHVTLCNVDQILNGETFGVRMDGTFLDWRNPAEFGLDGRVRAFDGTSVVNEDDFPVDALVETPWINFGTLERKQITKIVVDCRRWGGQDVYTANTDTMLAFLLDIFADGDVETIRETVQATHAVHEMRSAGGFVPLDENRQYALMSFELSPRVSGQNFKLRFRNKPTGSENQGPMRIVGIEVFYDQQESNRPLTAMNRS